MLNLEFSELPLSYIVCRLVGSKLSYNDVFFDYSLSYKFLTDVSGIIIIDNIDIFNYLFINIKTSDLNKVL